MLTLKDVLRVNRMMSQTEGYEARGHPSLLALAELAKDSPEGPPRHTTSRSIDEECYDTRDSEPVCP